MPVTGSNIVVVNTNPDGDQFLTSEWIWTSDFDNAKNFRTKEAARTALIASHRRGMVIKDYGTTDSKVLCRQLCEM